MPRIGSSGGKVMAIVQRQNAIKKHYENPNICENCHKVIQIKDGVKICEIRKKRFCNKSCAAIFRNKGKDKGVCKNCGCLIKFKRNKKGFLKRKYCKKCLSEVRAKAKGAETHIANLTRDQVMNKYQKYYIGRNMIRKHAKRVFEDSSKEKKCVMCGYDKHVDVAHINPVSNFDGNTLISTINHEDNLVSLCSNCHWEYDQGLIQIN